MHLFIPLNWLEEKDTNHGGGTPPPHIHTHAHTHTCLRSIFLDLGTLAQFGTQSLFVN